MVIRTILISTWILILTGCSSQPDHSFVDDALKDFSESEALAVPDDAYDALTPDIDQPVPRFDVVSKRNTARAFFHGLVDGMGINIVVHPDIKTRITLNLKDVTLHQTLQAVRDIYGLQYVQTPYGYRILPKSLQNRVFHVNYLNVSRSGTSGMSVSSGHINTDEINSSDSSSESNNSSNSVSTASKIETQATTDFWSNLQSSVSMIIGSGNGRRVIVDAQAGLVMVRGFPDELASVEDFLKRAELSLQKQVIIEAKILEVTLNSGFQSGIQWSSLSSDSDVTGQLTSEAILNPDNLEGIFSLNFNSSDFTGVIQLLQRGIDGE